MGHSKNPAIVERDMPLLLELKAGKSCRWQTQPDWPTTESLLRKLRQALSIASLHPERFPELASAAKTFALHVVEPGVIEARPKTMPRVETMARAEGTTMTGAVQGREVATVARATADEIIEVWRLHLPSSDPLNFPQTTLADDELLKLYRWAKDGGGPTRAVIVGKNFLTVSLWEKGLPEWTPPPSAQPTMEKSIYDIEPD